MSKLRAALNTPDARISSAILINACQKCIDQCLFLLASIPESIYIDESNGTSTVGAHMRHIIERFQCFLLGLPQGLVNYDNRKRDKNLQQNLPLASRTLDSIKQELLRVGNVDVAKLEIVESVNEEIPAIAVNSSIDRELMSLITHSIHHLAIIALLVKSHGYCLSNDIGKAPSTIKFERNK